MKNFRNNLLNRKKFVFPKFILDNGLNIVINFPAGFIQWKDLSNFYDKDKGLSASLNKIPKYSYQALHPETNKQSVLLALAIIRETTIAAARAYFPIRSDLSGFLNLINVWWTIPNLKQMYTPNVVGNTIIFVDKKTDFYRTFADWIKLWCASPSFKLTCQKKSAPVATFRAQADLIDKLIDDGYDFVRTSRFQSDPIEKCFSQYQQMSGGRFLVTLKEVLNSTRILSFQLLIKENINFWEENIDSDAEESLDSINDLSDERADNIVEDVLDDDVRDVDTNILGYVAKNLIKQNSCDLCNQTLASEEVDLKNDSYLKLLSHGGVIVPSRQLADVVCDCFAILDFLEKKIVLLEILVAKVATYTLKRYVFFNNFDAICTTTGVLNLH